MKKSDPALEITDDGFVVKREDREDLVYKGKIRDIAVMRDNYVLEIYVNGREEIYTAILC